MNTLNSKNDNFAESNTYGIDRFLGASVGTTPGTQSMFSTDDGRRDTRRSRRAALARARRRAKQVD